MNRQSILLSLGASLLAASLCAADTAAAASSEQQHKACRGDALHFCKAEIPNREKIIACMKQHLSELSPGCRAMFDENKNQESSDQ
ncbi:hypothetical protein [Paraburkholderia saeva]|jgi:hypothetical protein|uniref:Cysteine rich repeat-containing protein n=1 Tax=Paraburkholderia saeva TaxID=2777537 RepID=A0A9N8X0W4_9BURK|nr:hypothetical protein [Paraburkholderia saeva]CAG4888466.1 hypothetical protein R52603_00669 [Paraburkholderia saeva]CAG4895727.1 hypothetical protein LMG31841_02214 [Paraburkholderia saeva]